MSGKPEEKAEMKADYAEAFISAMRALADRDHGSVSEAPWELFGRAKVGDDNRVRDVRLHRYSDGGVRLTLVDFPTVNLQPSECSDLQVEGYLLKTDGAHKLNAYGEISQAIYVGLILDAAHAGYDFVIRPQPSIHVSHG